MLRNLDYQLVSLLTPEQAHTFQVIPYQMDGNVLHLLGAPASLRRQNALALLLGQDIQITSIDEGRIQQYLHTYYPNYQASPEEQVKKAPIEEGSDVSRLTDRLIVEAVGMNASDIHIERYETKARVRFRWEGQLVEKYAVTIEQYPALVSRIKIMAKLDIAEKRMPQDGRIRTRVGEEEVDIRVSVMPGVFGEKVVMRLLRRSEEQLQLAKIGMKEDDLAEYQRFIHKPNGLILITGPTGSGKTTTLYASLNELNDPKQNILTVEDPVEYNLYGIHQVQVKENIGLDFGTVLRAFLRQDPNVIMLGEIRDVETAQIALRASLTGHLVLSTLHTNSAWDAVSRLLDMGVESYLLAASLRLVVAQRLIRCLCEHCKEESVELLYPRLQDAWGIERHWVAKGCEKCFYTGYKGRRAVFDLLPISAELAERIRANQQNDAPKGKMLIYLQEMLQNGETALEEVMQQWDGDL